MTKSGEIRSTKASIISVLKEVNAAFEQITGEGKWQGDSMEELKQKTQKFVSEATSILQSKLDVLADFAQTFEDFESISKASASIRTERHHHCKAGHTCGNGCCCPPTYNKDGMLTCVWQAKGCFTGPRDQVRNNVQQMNSLHNTGASIKSSFPSSVVPHGEGIEPFFDYGG